MQTFDPQRVEGFSHMWENRGGKTFSSVLLSLSWNPNCSPSSTLRSLHPHGTLGSGIFWKSVPRVFCWLVGLWDERSVGCFHGCIMDRIRKCFHHGEDCLRRTALSTFVRKSTSALALSQDPVRNTVPARILANLEKLHGLYVRRRAG
jgi:hypothetical protein